MIPVRIPV